MDVSPLVEEAYKQLLEEILTEIVFQVEIEQHFEQSIQIQLRKYIKEEKVPINCHDIFNNSNSKDTNECVCPNCGRMLGALRFAPHLEKCVGMGRSSSRIASRRILASSNSGKEVKYVEDAVESNGSSQQSQNNAEWVPPKSSRRVDTRKKRDHRIAGKHYKNKKKVDDGVASHEAANGGGGSDDINYTTMSAEAKQHFLAHMCGVVSEHTGRLCTRSVRCPKHTDEQKNTVRSAVLGNNGAIQTDFAKMTVQEMKLNMEDTEMIEIDFNSISSPNKRSERHHRGKS
ncbi:hypothetical protein V9T40_007588 [Parthenolecanium corni]|uniref:SCA7 domain-containing protein n=1 Tax=Parthenolecanium corni TaxID=536013 RepID=A0AAN9THC0_9HEMI